jgi:hypothetical protein
MGNGTTISLLGAAKAHWRLFIPAWVFPVVLLFGGTLSERLGHPLLFFWLVAVPLFFWALSRASVPWRQGQLKYWPTVFWAMLVPFVIWAIAVYVHLLLPQLTGTSHAI